MGNPDRCAEAGLPDDISFETRPQQVIDMIDSAIEAKVPFAWCAADEEFGQNPGLCDHLHAAGISYVMAVPKNTTLIDTAGKEIKLQHLAPRLVRGADPHARDPGRQVLRPYCGRIAGGRLG